MTGGKQAPLQLSRELATIFQAACLAELDALKPGNVHVFADGHGMQVQDFVQSAEAAAKKIALPELSVGERIEQAIEATWEVVDCNTNLGIVLLGAPLVHAVLHGTGDTLRDRLHDVLSKLTVMDAEYAFRAILRASPAGLGDSPRHDVRQPAKVTLLKAMQEAQERDLIARQYATSFVDIFEIGVPQYLNSLQRWGTEPWATSSVYLRFLSNFHDTHVVRKYGKLVAMKLRAEAEDQSSKLLACENPKILQGDLIAFDRSLKAQGLNPGTSADLTVASVLVVLLEKLCNHGSLFRAMALTATQAAKMESGEL